MGRRRRVNKVRAAMLDAGRKLLRETLVAHGWNFTATARALDTTSQNVGRLIGTLGLWPELEAARARGEAPRRGPR